MRALTVKQPWASLIVAGVKDVENRTWAVPSTLPQWVQCDRCGRRSRDGEPERGPGDGIHYTDVCAPKRGLVGSFRADGPFPFRLAIHAGRSDDPRGFAAAQYHGAAPAGLHEYQQWVHELPRGARLGYVTVTGCHHADVCFPPGPAPEPHDWGCSRWAEPTAYHWTLTGPQPLAEPIPMRGRQGLWTVPDDALEAVQP